MSDEVTPAVADTDVTDVKDVADKTDAATDVKTDIPSEPMFKQYIPEESKDAPFWGKITDDASLVKAYINAQGLIGKKGVILPGEKDSPEIWGEFYKALGRPESPDKYEIPKPADFPAGFQYDENREKNFKEISHKLGLNPAQVKGLYEWQVGNEIAGFKTYMDTFTEVDGLGLVPKQWVEDHNKVVEDFKKELGDEYTPLLSKAHSCVLKHGGQELKDFYDKTGFGDNPLNIRAWVNVAKATMTEDDFVTGKGAGVASLDEQIAEINSNPALLDEKDPKHRETVRKRDELYEQRWGKPKE